MIDDKAGISAAAAKSHKQVIWDLQALGCLSHGGGGGIISPQHKGLCFPEHPAIPNFTVTRMQTEPSLNYVQTPAHVIIICTYGHTTCTLVRSAASSSPPSLSCSLSCI